MSVVNAPSPKIDQRPTRAQMVAATEAFLAPDGALAEFATAGLALRKCVEAAMYTPIHHAVLEAQKVAFARRHAAQILLGLPETTLGAPKEDAKPKAAPHKVYATKSHRRGVSVEEVEDFLIDHTGLSGEFNNGIKRMVQFYTDHAEIRLEAGKLEEGAAEVTKVLEHPSQLTDTRPETAKKIGITKETNREALGRVAKQIEQWKDFNFDKGLITEQAAFNIEGALEGYEAKLADVLAFADKAKAYSETVIESPARGRKK